MTAIAGIIIVGFVLYVLCRVVPRVAQLLILLVAYPKLLWQNTIATFTPGSSHYRYRILTIVSIAIFAILLITTIIVATLQ